MTSPAPPTLLALCDDLALHGQFTMPTQVALKASCVDIPELWANAIAADRWVFVATLAKSLREPRAMAARDAAECLGRAAAGLTLAQVFAREDAALVATYRPPTVRELTAWLESRGAAGGAR